MWISHTTLSYMLHTKVYMTYRAGIAFTNDKPLATPSLPAKTFTLPKAQGQFSLRLDVYSPSQVLQTYGRFYHVDLAFLFVREITYSRVPLLGERYLASSLVRTHPPPFRLRLISLKRLYSLPFSVDFSMGRGGLRQLLGVSLPPCRRWYPAGGNCRLSQYAKGSTVFDIK
jgi:hypothetical protein